MNNVATQATWDSANRIGCAVSQSKSAKVQDKPYPYITWLACDYSYGNMADSPVYVAGPMASKCSTGPNPKWEGLCSTAEKYAN